MHGPVCRTGPRAMTLFASVLFVLLAIFAAPASANHQPPNLTLEPERDTNTVGEQHCVTARLRQTGHGSPPIAGATIRFSVTGANTATGTGVTGADGRATFCYTGTTAGEDLIAAFADLDNDGQRDAGEPLASASKTYRPGPTTTVTVSPAAAVNTVGEPHCVTATATDQFGNPTPGVALLFSVAGANPTSGTRTTGTNGQATFCYTGQNAGSDSIRVTADLNSDGVAALTEPTALATKVYRPAGPSALTLTPPAATNPTGEPHCVTATATNLAGQPSAGVRIVFAVSGANPRPPTARTTDANGQATFCYTGTNVGLDLITGFTDSNGNGTQDAGELVATATKTYVPGAPATVLVMPPAAENTVGTQHCVSASVQDAFGNPVPDATVFFSVSGANARTATAKTDANGNATFCYTGTQAGLDTIVAVADADGDNQSDATDPRGSATKLYHPGIPAAVTVSPPAAVNEAGEQHCVTATVHDQFGNLVGPGHAVVFSVTGSNPRGPETRTTDARGQATFCYTGTRAGEDVITAVADANGNGQADAGEPTGVATKTYRPGPPGNITLAPPSATNVAGEQHCVTATVTDRFGNPTPGVAVDFSVSGANTAAGVDVTTLQGEARFCYTGTKAGTDTITATVPGTELEATATKTYRPGAPAAVDVTPAAAVNQAGEQHCVTAAVADRFGNLVGAGVRVIFSVAGANPTAAPVVETTDQQSQATFCYTGTRAGEDVITAVADTNGNGQADAGEPTGVATKTYRPGPPAKLTLEPKTATNTVGEEHCVTATVTDAFGNPNEGVTVRFSVTGSVATGDDGVELGASGSDTTDRQGKAEFCYTSELPGENVITAYADTNGSGTHDPGEPADIASKTYVVPLTSPLCDVSINDGGWITTLAGDRGTFGGNAKTDSGGRVVSGSQEYTDHGPAASLNAKSTQILAVVCEGNRATIYGTARVEATPPYTAGTHAFRIRVMDSGEPGRADTYGILLSNGYWSGDERPLQGGNVQVRTG